MLSLVLAMLVIVVLATLVVAFVAFPLRGLDIPGAPWLSTAMSRAAEGVDPEGDEYGAAEPTRTPVSSA